MTTSYPSTTAHDSTAIQFLMLDRQAELMGRTYNRANTLQMAMFQGVPTSVISRIMSMGLADVSAALGGSF